MAICTGRNYTSEIDRTECIGNSLVTINNNFKNLDESLCSVINTVVTPLPALEMTATFTVLSEHHDRTIVIDSSSSVDIILPTGLPIGTQVSFIRGGTGSVKFASQNISVNIRSTPTNAFISFAFQNSVATAYYWKNNTWYVFGDLIPV